jgi:hypothetical protein
MRLVASVVLLLLAPGASPLRAQGAFIPADQVCASNDSIFVGPCRSFQARLTPGADNISIRIWPVGTNRLLGYADGALKCHLPPMLERLMDEGKTVYADLTVRPVTRSQPGHMQFACVASAQHMKVEGVRTRSFGFIAAAPAATVALPSQLIPVLGGNRDGSQH